MTSPTYYGLPRSSVLVPFAAVLVLAGVWGRELGLVAILGVATALTGGVLMAVHHAEVVAHRVGEPYGTLVLALAVTVIEVVLIVALMLAGGPATATLARDTVFATVMIVCNGIVGLCVLVGALRHGVIAFRVQGTSPALAVLAALATLTLVMPTFTTSTPGATFAPSQLVFAGIVSLALYGVFVFVQTVRHREYFLPVAGEDETLHAPAVSGRTALASVGLLLVCLVAVVGLAKTLAPTIEQAVHTAGAPQAVVGIVIALLVLLPEGWAAVRAAARNHLQTSLNLAIGSALASIGLTIPALAALSPLFTEPLTLGLAPKEIVLLTLTLLVGVLTLGSGKATVMQGAVHLVLFAVFLFLAVVP